MPKPRKSSSPSASASACSAGDACGGEGEDEGWGGGVRSALRRSSQLRRRIGRDRALALVDCRHLRASARRSRTASTRPTRRRVTIEVADWMRHAESTFYKIDGDVAILDATRRLRRPRPGSKRRMLKPTEFPRASRNRLHAFQLEWRRRRMAGESAHWIQQHESARWSHRCHRLATSRRRAGRSLQTPGQSAHRQLLRRRCSHCTKAHVAGPKPDRQQHAGIRARRPSSAIEWRSPCGVRSERRPGHLCRRTLPARRADLSALAGRLPRRRLRWDSSAPATGRRPRPRPLPRRR